MSHASTLSSPPRSTASRLFWVQYNVILVGGAALFSLALASPWPLAAALLGEILWLGIGSSSAGVRGWLDRRDAANTGSPDELEPVRSAAPLAPEYVRRATTLDRALLKIRELGGQRPPPAFVAAVSRLETVRPVYLGLCETHQRIGQFLRTSTEASLVSEAERLKAAFTAEKDLGLRLTLRQALGLATRRIEHQRSMVQLQRGIGVKLESIERSLAFFVSLGPTLGANARLGDDVEALLSEVGPAIQIDVEPASLRPAPA